MYNEVPFPFLQFVYDIPYIAGIFRWCKFSYDYSQKAEISYAKISYDRPRRPRVI